MSNLFTHSLCCANAGFIDAELDKLREENKQLKNQHSDMNQNYSKYLRDELDRLRRIEEAVMEIAGLAALFDPSPGWRRFQEWSTKHDVLLADLFSKRLDKEDRNPLTQEAREPKCPSCGSSDWGIEFGECKAPDWHAREREVWEQEQEYLNADVPEWTT